MQSFSSDIDCQIEASIVAFDDSARRFSWCCEQLSPTRENPRQADPSTIDPTIICSEFCVDSGTRVIRHFQYWISSIADVYRTYFRRQPVQVTLAEPLESHVTGRIAPVRARARAASLRCVKCDHRDPTVKIKFHREKPCDARG